MKPFLAILGITLLGHATIADQAVQARLLIPPAETHVIGDTILLFWEFDNHSPEPLAFLWEGCCRLNGRLQVTQDDQPLDPIPPGAAIAHQFAKAETLQPGEPGQFETRLSDWVQLRQTGRYRLEGRYVGVLPTQQPQVPPSLALWRGAAETPPIWIDVLAPDDYLNQRQTRSQTRPWHATLTGPDRLTPLDPVNFTVTFHNRTPSSQDIIWPGAAQLWLINPAGERLGIRFLQVPPETITLPPQATVQRSFALHSEDLLSAPFGSYRVFVDLPGEPEGRLRCPSNPVTVQWELQPAEVDSLIEQAARGPKMGLRNKPLKLLRVYLSQLGPALEKLDLSTLPDSARDLAQELKWAACLKPFEPTPGRVEFSVRISSSGQWLLADPALPSCLASPEPAPPATQMTRLLSVRRHLGWSLAPQIEPDPTLPLGRLYAAIHDLNRFQEGLANLPQTRLTSASPPATNQVTFQTELIPADFVLRALSHGQTIRLELARRWPNPSQPDLAVRFTPQEIRQATFTPLPNVAALRAALEDRRQPFPHVLVLADPAVAWKDLVTTLQPLVEKGLPADLTLLNPPIP